MAKFEIKNGVAIIPEGTTEIGDWAFSDCSSLYGHKYEAYNVGATQIGCKCLCFQ